MNRCKKRGRYTLLLSFFTGLFLIPTSKIFAQAPRFLEGQYIVEREPLPETAQARRKHNGNIHQVAIPRVSLAITSSLGESAPASNAPVKSVDYIASRDICAALRAKDPSITSCSPNFVRPPLLTPNDRYFRSQTALRDVTLMPQSAYGIRGPLAWEHSSGSRNVIVAVLDTGMDMGHPDLVNNLWINPNEIAGNGIDDDGNGYIDDIHGASIAYGTGDPSDIGGALSSTFAGHGTHVSGILGAEGNNAIGVSGVNWQISILPVGIYHRDIKEGSAFDVIRGFDYLTDLKVNHGINITAINASFGGPGYSEPEYQAVKRARDAGIVVVTAAGNESSNNDPYTTYRVRVKQLSKRTRRIRIKLSEDMHGLDQIFPAGYDLDNILSVGAADENGELAYFSNYGATSVDVLAPGVEILSTVPGGGYDYKQGTSMATPFVTGAVALLKSQRPELGYAQLRAAIKQAAYKRVGLEAQVSSGGLLDLAALFELGEINTFNTPTSPPASDIYLGLSLNGKVCPKSVSLNGAAERLYSFEGKFAGKGSQAFSLRFYIYSPEGAVIDQATLQVRPSTKNLSKQTTLTNRIHDRLCDAFMNSLRYINASPHYS